MKVFLKNYLLIGQLIITLLSIGCTPVPQIKLTNRTQEPLACINGSTGDLICNPFGGNSGVPLDGHGLYAKIYEGEIEWRVLDNYFINGNMHVENIYFSNFNVPERIFSEGFGASANEFLKNKKGEKLVEWFSIKAKGNIVLPKNESIGFYHIVSLSDDGVKVIIAGETIINKQNPQSPTIDCANKLIYFSSNLEQSFELSYFQGPRNRIALSTFIKKIDNPAGFTNGSYCGLHDPQLLLNDGYKIIEPAWFTLPAGP